MGAREFTDAEARYLAKATDANDADRRLAILERPAPAVVPAPPVATKWAMWQEQAKQVPGALVRNENPPPVLVELLVRTEAQTSRARTMDRLPARWTAFVVDTGKRIIAYLYELTDVEASHPLVIAELARRAAVIALRNKRLAAEKMFAALEQIAGVNDGEGCEVCGFHHHVGPGADPRNDGDLTCIVRVALAAAWSGQ